MAAIDQARRHFSGIGTRTIDVPEWRPDPDKPVGADNPALIIRFTAMTLDEKQRAANAREREGYVASLADVVIMKALDAEGRKLFTIDNKHALRHEVDPDVLARVVTQMMASPSVEDMLGNLSGTRSSG